MADEIREHNMTDETSGISAPGAWAGAEPPDSGLETGMYTSDADDGHVWVRRGSAGEVVRARLSGYPPGFELEPGDRTALELVDGLWHTIPSITETVRLNTRVEWWTQNLRTGRPRFLAEKRLH